LPWAIDRRDRADALIAARLLTLPACQGNWGNALHAAASGGYGEAVTDRQDLVPALSRALHAVQAEHRQAVVNVSCAD
jgi:hypothetical protein